jgi:anti-sigma B factor antagonist
MASEAFHIDEELEGGLHKLTLRGELDIASAPALESTVRRLCQDGATEVVLDLTRLEFIDSTGLNAVLRTKSICEEHLCAFHLTSAQRPVQRVFELTRLIDRLPFRRSGHAETAGPNRP